MSMHQGLDLSRFSKVASDKHTTTLRHAKGHEVKVVHSALTPKMREDLSRLPTYMADGGEVDADAEAEADPLAESRSVPQGSEASPPLDAESPEPAADTPAEVPAAAPSGIPPNPNAGKESPVSEANTIDVIGRRPSQPAPPTAQQLDAEDAAWANDMRNGHITPETYQGLFAKKDTLGKIGSIFGLLVGGAGSGLAHQPNIAMEMMNREINNDLQAQIQSKHNAVNYYNSALNMLKGGADAEYTASQTTLNKMKIAAGQELMGIVDKIPPGPYQAKAMQLLQQMMPNVQAGNAAANANTANALQARHVLRNAAGGGPGQSGAVNYGRLKKLGQLGQLGIPGGMDSGQVAAAGTEAAAVEHNRAMAKMYDHAFNQLDTLTAGQSGEAVSSAMDLLQQVSKMAPGMAAQTLGAASGAGANLARKFQQFRLAQVATLGNEIAKATTGRYNREEAGDIADGLFPSVYDLGDKSLREEKYRNGISWFQSQEAGTPTLSQWNLKTNGPYDDYLASYHKKASTPENVAGGKKETRKKIDFASPTVQESMAK